MAFLHRNPCSKLGYLPKIISSTGNKSKVLESISFETLISVYRSFHPVKNKWKSSCQSCSYAGGVSFTDKIWKTTTRIKQKSNREKYKQKVQKYTVWKINLIFIKFKKLYILRGILVKIQIVKCVYLWMIFLIGRFYISNKF